MGRQRISNIALIEKGTCQICSQQWYRSYHRYLWSSKWQRQLSLLTCFTSSSLIDVCVRILSLVLLCRPMLVNYMTLVSFQFLRKNLGNLQDFRPPPPPPHSLAKNCPHAYGLRNKENKKYLSGEGIFMSCFISWHVILAIFQDYFVWKLKMFRKFPVMKYQCDW